MIGWPLCSEASPTANYSARHHRVHHHMEICTLNVDTIAAEHDFYLNYWVLHRSSECLAHSEQNQTLEHIQYFLSKIPHLKNKQLNQ